MKGLFDIMLHKLFGHDPEIIDKEVAQVREALFNELDRMDALAAQRRIMGRDYNDRTRGTDMDDYGDHRSTGT